MLLLSQGDLTESDIDEMVRVMGAGGKYQHWPRICMADPNVPFGGAPPRAVRAKLPMLSFKGLQAVVPVSVVFESRIAEFKTNTDSSFKAMTDRRVSIGERRAEELFNLPYTVLAYSGDSLVFWNNNDIIPSTNALATPNEYSLQQWKNGFYLLRLIRYRTNDRDIRYAFIQPVKFDYATSNEYLIPGYAEDFNIDAHITLSSRLNPSAIPVSLPDGNAFYTSYDASYVEKETDSEFYLLFLTGVLVSLAGLYTLLFAALPSLQFSASLLVHAGLVYALHFVFHLLQPVPEAFLQWEIFNPNYYASPYVSGSLGMLFIELMAVLLSKRDRK